MHRTFLYILNMPDIQTTNAAVDIYVLTSFFAIKARYNNFQYTFPTFFLYLSNQHNFFFVAARYHLLFPFDSALLPACLLYVNIKQDGALRSHVWCIRQIEAPAKTMKALALEKEDRSTRLKIAFKA